MIFPDKLIYDTSSLEGIISQYNIKFFDFGCSHGGAMKWIKKHLHYVDLGFDIDQKKINLCDSNKMLCSNIDILKLPDKQFVDEIVMFHFLEHLDSIHTAEKFIKKACDCARNNITIKQPFFDADNKLLERGFKTYYSHWTGHKNRMQTFDFFIIFDKMKKMNKIYDYQIWYKKPIVDSGSEYILPYTEKIDSLNYDKDVHAKKLFLKFDFDLYYEIMIFIDLNGGGFSKICETLSPDKKFEIG